MKTRPATLGDIGGMVALIEARRERLARYQPVMWARAPHAADASSGWYTILLSQPDTIAMVAHDEAGLAGMAIALLQSPPPVYQPGGPVCFLDDFASVEGPRGDRAALVLLDAITAEGRRRGAALMIAVAAAADETLAGLLRLRGLAPASQWWAKPL